MGLAALSESLAETMPPLVMPTPRSRFDETAEAFRRDYNKSIEAFEAAALRQRIRFNQLKRHIEDGFGQAGSASLQEITSAIEVMGKFLGVLQRQRQDLSGSLTTHIRLVSQLSKSALAKQHKIDKFVRKHSKTISSYTMESMTKSIEVEALLENLIFELKSTNDAKVTHEIGSSLDHDLERIGRYEENWDGRGSAAPSRTIIDRAQLWLSDMSRLVGNTNLWARPHVGCSEVGEIIFEWWNKSKKITLYIGEDTVLSLKIWGANIDTEMEEVELDQISDFLSIWDWYGQQ